MDDDENNLSLMEAYLIMDYNNLLMARSGEEALEKVNTNSIDLIILDIMMPGISGYEVCEKLKSSPDTESIPIVMATALSGKEDCIKSIQAGADDFLTKPVNSLELNTRVRSLLRIKLLHDELVQERDHLNMQNRIRTVLTTIIPSLLTIVPPEQKKVIILQMINMVETIIGQSCDDHKETINIDNIGEVCCRAMNQLGGGYYVETSDGDSGTNICTVKARTCPWGKREMRINPIMCNLTRGIFSRIADSSLKNGYVDVLKTMGNGDEYCHFAISDTKNE